MKDTSMDIPKTVWPLSGYTRLYEQGERKLLNKLNQQLAEKFIGHKVQLTTLVGSSSKRILHIGVVKYVKLSHDYDHILHIDIRLMKKRTCFYRIYPDGTDIGNITILDN